MPYRFGDGETAGAERQRMILGERGFAPEASGNRCAEKFREGPKLGPSLRPVNACASINHWALSSRQNCGGPLNILWIGPNART
jgi:hypothetical protein